VKSISNSVIIEVLFGVDQVVLIEGLTGFILRYLFYTLITCVIILLLFLVARVLDKKLLLKRGFLGFLRRYRISIPLQSLLITLFITAVTHNALFEFLVFVVMWAQLEAALTLWRIETGPYLTFTVSKCAESTSEELCVFTYIRAKNSGKIPLRDVSLTRVFIGAYEFTPLKPEIWAKHLKINVVNLNPGEEKPVVSAKPEILKLYVDKVFEICYSTPLAPEECTYVLLTIKDLILKYFTLDVVPLNTPLLKLYKMWREILSLPVFALRRLSRTRYKY